MRKYLFVEYQENGCDYTIGCGVRLTVIVANSDSDALEKFKSNFLRGELLDYSINPLRSGNAPDSFEIYEIARTVPFCDRLFQGWIDEWDEVIKKQKEKKEYEKDRALYEKLKKKYEKS